ncbi:hypothetical protein ACFQ3S_08050 [Mucilaginibacter terrae]|uniref:hypothetical protein n=1 Tax=Mucilaginibacter terrae TaxID=1955052 RepID=UPI0036437105
MVPNDDEPTQDYPHASEQPAHAPAGGYKVEDDDNLEEKDLKRSFLGGEDANPNQHGYESHGMGGESFGEINETRSGDDLANPSRNAGYTNDYFKRTEPLQEHPENQNFKPVEQEGEPDMNQGKEEVAGYREAPEQQKVGGVEDDHNQTQEGTSDNDGDQQKVNQDDSDTPGTAYYKPEDDKGTPDYGSHSPENK